MLAAADLAANHRLGIWDAVVLSAAAAAGCRLLLSEDLQGGFTWNGVTVTNPFLRKSMSCCGIVGTLKANRELKAAKSPTLSHRTREG